jgi:hypothetical protein
MDVIARPGALAEATTGIGPFTVALLAGELTATPAKAIEDVVKIAASITIQRLVSVLNIYSNTPVLSTFGRA